MSSSQLEDEELERAGGQIDAGPSVGSMGSIEQVTWRNAICKTRHPAIAFSHVAFKGLALVVYFCQKLLGLEYVSLFVVVVLLLAADFWVVKNLSGRLLVGLRWWNRIKEDGTNEWIYESSPNAANVPGLDRRIFWWPLYIAPLVWGTFAILAFVSFSWDYLPLHFVAASLTGSNALGYTRCSSDAQRRLQSSIAAGALTGLGYVPGALPALGSTLMTLLRPAAAPVVLAPGTGSGAGARPMQSGSLTDFDAVQDPFGRGSVGGAYGARQGSGQGGRGGDDLHVTI